MCRELESSYQQVFDTGPDEMSRQPTHTGGLEVSKMKAYRTLGGAALPPYYGEYVLPTYASVIVIELVPNQP